MKRPHSSTPEPRPAKRQRLSSPTPSPPPSRTPSETSSRTLSARHTPDPGVDLGPDGNDWSNIPLSIACCTPSSAYPNFTTRQMMEMERAAAMPIPDYDDEEELRKREDIMREDDRREEEEEKEKEAIDKTRREVNQWYYQQLEERDTRQWVEGDESPIVIAMCCVGPVYEWTQQHEDEMERASRTPLPDEDW
ncbi:hypothetical protein P153DRAFT_390242 [Dothidotthia symphoricarpi CBS 119687]|uniref:Uncharacterized protein n=1 Tax=Dothidotthia symphoricarpi CBS 119687 TaxID=1392245 RepID=A0A6A6A0V0_9PLEO|nr:uncharacterized protein P153DRAFT_390242 [Dothidotthia symphoricarpi CBS 119687]KAF2124774.1 hypothetical protein P153DRAFT_390242 [Dothidotthia symphoricarpi CBS 119687]